MKQIADDVYLLRGFPPNAINVYLVGDVLVDAASKHAGRRILRQLEGREVAAHALTHAHPDHQGASDEVCEKLGIPYWVGSADVEAAESGDIKRFQPPHPMNRLMHAVFSGPGRPVDRQLNEGDEVAGFTVLDTPGHSRGHVSFWRESDRTLICGDVLNGMNLVTTIPGLHEPYAVFTPDPARNRESAKRLGELEPALVCFGHGPPWRDTGKFVEFCRSL
ncbi:MAG TPA: MBL fold metallo-hydrolase [Thermoleophilaceae bacterium]|nr:MBL fold metallo-hydrolase [Thermoleophilaceae bacterium]